MRRWTILAAALAVAGCGVKYGQEGGWTRMTMQGVPPTLQYRPAAGGTFVALCDEPGKVSFSLLGGGNPPSIQRFTVTAGAWRHEFETYNAQQNQGLVMLPAGDSGSAAEAADGRAIAQALAQTTAPIVFSAEGWSRAIPASAEIGKFVAECRAETRSSS